MRIETRWTDDDGEGPGRFHVIVAGQDCGPSVPCEKEAFGIMQERLENMLKHATNRAYEIGRCDVQDALRRAIGVGR